MSKLGLRRAFGNGIKNLRGSKTIPKIPFYFGFGDAFSKRWIS
jgi:hypothetical protein